MDFSNQTFYEIIPILKDKLIHQQTIDFRSNNKDIKAWSDLANILLCKISHIQTFKDHIELSFQKLNPQQSFHKDKDIEEKYGTDSTFFTLNKMEQPAFLHYYLQALDNIKIGTRKRVLNLGISFGDEFDTIVKHIPNHQELQFVGIDYCKSTIEYTKERFKIYPNMEFYSCDIKQLHQLNLGVFDAIITIGTLQSRSLEFKPTFMNIIQNYLKKDGSLIMGFPNCRWIDGEMIYGAKAPNYKFSEMGILYNDVIFCKKYLQQKKFRVTLTGKEYIFLTATSIR